MGDTSPTLHDINAKLVALIRLLTTNKNVLAFEEAARYLDLADSYLYKLTSSQQIPFYKPNGKKLYFKREELDARMLQNRIQTTEEIQAIANNHVAGFGR